MLKKFWERRLKRGRGREHWWRHRLGAGMWWGLARLLGAKTCRDPVFVVGSPHSGTSLILRILGEHSAFYTVPYESQCAASWALDVMCWKFNMLAWLNGRRRWLEKTPCHIRYLALLTDRFPEARFLIIIRDGRDVANSLKKRGRCSLEEGIDYWASTNRAGELFWNHPRVMKFTYEEFVARTDATLKRILDFLGEPFEEGLKNYHERPRALYAADLNKPASEKDGSHHDQYRNWQINQPIFDGRGKWKKELSTEELALIEQHAGEMLRAYGYPPE